MTVKELIEILQTVDPDTLVVIKAPDGGFYCTYDEISKEDVVVDSDEFKIYL